jgi:hypothetical protein
MKNILRDKKSTWILVGRLYRNTKAIRDLYGTKEMKIIWALTEIKGVSVMPWGT